MRRFCLYRRGRIWYAKFYNPSTRTYMTGRSTGEFSRDAALLTVAEWLSSGVPEPKQKGTRPIATAFEIHSVMTALRALPLTMVDAEKVIAILRDRELIESAVVKAGPGLEPLISFLERFWNYDASPYVREKLAHEQRISRRHCYCASLDVRKHWKYFGERRLAEIRKADLQAFALWLKEKKGHKGKTVNNILAAGTVAVRRPRKVQLPLRRICRIGRWSRAPRIGVRFCQSWTASYHDIMRLINLQASADCDMIACPDPHHFV